MVFATLSSMRTVTLPLPAFGFVVATRAALAAGLGLLAADKIPAERRRIVGASLVLFGAATTIPAVKWISRGWRRLPDGVAFDAQLIGASRFPRKGDDQLW
jgi:hypothetical protein